MKRLKGQAAVEYLVTYGWAMLILVIVIGAIIGSGVFSPAYLVSEECNLGPGFPCTGQIYGDDDTLYTSVRIVNGFGYKVLVREIRIYTKLNETNSAQPDAVLSAGEDLVETLSVPGLEPSPNKLESIRVEVEYVNCAHEVNPECEDLDELSHVVSGRILARTGTT